MTSHMPATAALISIVKQRYAGAALGGLNAVQFVMAGLFIQARAAGGLGDPPLAALFR
jgi:hypothetical protein